MFAHVTGFEVSLFDELRRLQRDSEELFAGRGRTGDIRVTQRGAFPAIDVASTPEKVDIYLSAPGIDPKALDISITQNVLTVTGARQLPTDGKAVRSRQERFSGEFRRSLSLPQDVDSQRVEASYVDGVVRITVQRRAAPKPRQIEIH
jgi:HSP20 family protein